MLQLHRRHLLDHRHHWSPRQRSPCAAHTHQCLSRGIPPGRLQCWIFLCLRMSKVSSLILHVMRSSSGGSLGTSTTTSLGCPVMATSSSSATPTKKKRYVRRMPPMPKLRLLLLQGSRPQPSLLPTLMKHPQGCKMIIVVIAPPIGKLTVAATSEMKQVRLSLSCQGGACREECFKENCHYFALLHHNFFCKKEW
jgi:hypothetical protein